VEQSAYNFEHADTGQLFHRFDALETECQALVAQQLPLAAFERMLASSHSFNLLDARHAISVTERQGYILRVRALARAVAQSYYESREAMGFPMQKKAAA
jgi:glycyl-tRNA synthetase alpha chain